MINKGQYHRRSKVVNRWPIDVNFTVLVCNCDLAESFFQTLHCYNRIVSFNKVRL